jgi:hypothetical protein
MCQACVLPPYSFNQRKKLRWTEGLVRIVCSFRVDRIGTDGVGENAEIVVYSPFERIG